MSLNLIMGARNNAVTERESNDFYATHPQAVHLLLEQLKKDNVVLNKNIWECACGQGHMAEVFKKYGYDVIATDLVNRGYGDELNFLTQNLDFAFKLDIFTNPPFKYALEFAYKGIQTLPYPGCKLGLFLKIQFLESKERKELFEHYPPKYVYIYSMRQHCAKNADFERFKAKTQAYIWVIWEKNYQGETILRWI